MAWSARVQTVKKGISKTEDTSRKRPRFVEIIPFPNNIDPFSLWVIVKPGLAISQKWMSASKELTWVMAAADHFSLYWGKIKLDNICLKFLSETIREEIHLQESTFFTLTLEQNASQYPLHHVTYAPVKLRRKCIYKKVHYLTLAQNVAQYPLHHVTCAPAKLKRKWIYKKIHYFTFDLGVKVI